MAIAKRNQTDFSDSLIHQYESDFRDHVHRVLSYWLETLQISQSELAAFIGVRRTTLLKWVNNGNLPNGLSYMGIVKLHEIKTAIEGIPDSDSIESSIREDDWELSLENLQQLGVDVDSSMPIVSKKG